MNLKKGIWILPLRERLQETIRLFQSIQFCDKEARVVAVIDLDDPGKSELMDLCTYYSVEYQMSSEQNMTSEKINQAVKSFPGERFYGLLANDIEIRTPGALSALALNCPFMGLSYCDDSIHGQNLPTHPCVSGALVETLGWWAFPLAGHNDIDIYLQECANAAGGCKYLPEHVFYHWHESEKRAESDSVDMRRKSFSERDSRARSTWYFQGVREANLKRVRESWEQMHVK